MGTKNNKITTLIEKKNNALREVLLSRKMSLTQDDSNEFGYTIKAKQNIKGTIIDIKSELRFNNVTSNIIPQDSQFTEFISLHCHNYSNEKNKDFWKIGRFGLIQKLIARMKGHYFRDLGEGFYIITNDKNLFNNSKIWLDKLGIEISDFLFIKAVFSHSVRLKINTLKSPIEQYDKLFMEFERLAENVLSTNLWDKKLE